MRAAATMSRFRWFHSVRALRVILAGNLAVAGTAGATSVYLTRRLIAANEIQAEIGSARAESISLYAQGLQMSQATRNIVLEPSNHTAYKNHAAAVNEFKGSLASLEQRAMRLRGESDVAALLSGIAGDFRAHVTVQARIHQLAGSDQDYARKMLNTEDTPLWRKYKQNILEVAQRFQAVGEQTQATARRDSWSAQTLAWLSAVLLVLASLYAFVASGQVSRRLTGLANTLLAAAAQIANAAGLVATTSESLVGSASEQAAAVEETSAAGEEINSVAQRNSQNSRSASGLATRSQDLVHATSLELQHTVGAIDAISESSGQVSKIIKVVDEIAFQTNILALNAAVEAARAGEAGLGFSIVADEVRNLARRSAEAAAESASLIAASHAKVRDGKERVAHVSTAFQNLAAESGRIQTLVDEISMGSGEQAKGIEQVAIALARMERMTQTTSSSAEQGAAAAQELNAQAASLRELVEQLNLVVLGDNS